jgi:hypothetical protein
MDALAELLREVIFSYAGGGHNLLAFPLINEEKQVYTVLVVDYPVHKRPPMIVVLARIENGKIIVEEDITDRPVVDALVARGVSRENIILVYADEPLPSELSHPSQ